MPVRVKASGRVIVCQSMTMRPIRRKPRMRRERLAMMAVASGSPVEVVSAGARCAGDEGEPGGGGEFDQGILRRDGLGAVAATAAEQQPAEQRDVVVPADEAAALRAARTRSDDAFAVRKTRDADVEEAAEEQAEQEAGQLERECERCVHGPSIEGGAIVAARVTIRACRRWRAEARGRSRRSARRCRAG